MSKGSKNFDIGDCLIDLAVRIIRITGVAQHGENNTTQKNKALANISQRLFA